MKAAVIRDFLEVWIKHKGGRWEQIEGRPGERPHEYLIGEPELPQTREVEFGGVPHFIIKVNEPVARPWPAPFCSSDAPRLTEAEMLDIINHRRSRSYKISDSTRNHHGRRARHADGSIDGRDPQTDGPFLTARRKQITFLIVSGQLRRTPDPAEPHRSACQ